MGLLNSKKSRDPWGMRNRKMQCHLQHGWLQRNRSFEHGCAINRMFALRQPSQMLWSTVPRESQHPQGQFHRVSSFWLYEGWCVRTNTLASIFTGVIPCCKFFSSSAIHLKASAADLQCPTGHIQCLLNCPRLQETSCSSLRYKPELTTIQYTFPQCQHK